MEPFLDNILIYIIFSPLLAAAVLLLMPRDEKPLLRWLALIFSLGTLALILVAWFNYDRVDAGFQFQIVQEWFPQLGSSFHLGVDGISLPMLLLTGILTPLAILASFKIEDKAKQYLILFLILEAAMLGLFVSLDLLVFFVFWEFGLVPMYFLIRYWGGKDRKYASFKFMIYTMAGSLGLLLAIQVMGLAMGTFVTMTAVDDSRDRAEEAIGRAYEEIDRLVRIFSRHDSATPLSLLNQEGVLPDAPPELIDLVRRSAAFHNLSRGADCPGEGEQSSAGER